MAWSAYGISSVLAIVRDRMGLTVIKLGGSLLTDKSKPYTMRKEKFREIARELKESMDEMIIVHGVGSYGHPPVKEYKLYKGYTGKENLLNLAKTQSIVFELRLEFVRALQEEGINAMIFLPSSQIVAEGMKIKKICIEPIKRFLEMGMTPVFGGDIVVDTKMGYSVCSGDLIAAHLASELNAERLIFATDVDGIYTKDPKKDKNAKLLKEINLENMDELARLTGSAFTDVTSGMYGKIETIRKYRNDLKNTEIVILSMLKEGNLKAYMRNMKDAKFTKIKIK